jgi:hypothetical protein
LQALYDIIILTFMMSLFSGGAYTESG